MEDKTNSSLKMKRIASFFVSLLLVCLSYYICCKFSMMVYHTNDDLAIQNCLSGFKSGENDPVHQFISVFIGYPLACLYNALPNIQWWFVYSQILMFTGTVMVIFSFLQQGEVRNGYAVVFAFLVSVVFLLLFSMPAFASTAFTIVPAIFGSGIIATVYQLGIRKERKTEICQIILLFLSLLCVFHRKQSGQVVIANLLIVFLYIQTERYGIKRGLIKWILPAVLLIGIMFILTTANTSIKASINGREFTDFNRARGKFSDYPHDSFDDNPELYEAVGWNRDTYVMADSSCFIDERIGEEELSYITANSKAKKESVTAAWSAVGTNSKNLLISVVIISLLCVIVLIITKAGYKKLLFFSTVLLCSAAIILYQLLTGRIIYRSVVVTLVPTFTVIALLTRECISKVKRGELNCVRQGIMVFTALLAFIGLFCNSYRIVTTYVGINYTGEISENDDIVNKYFLNHKENLYITQGGIKRNIDPRLIYPGQNISNTLSWGGATYKSHTFSRILGEYGLERLNEDAFARDNVCFVSPVDMENGWSEEKIESNARYRAFYAFIRFMQEKRPDLEIKKTDTITNNVFVYHFCNAMAEADHENTQ